MPDTDILRRFAQAPVARLATVGRSGGPHLVPVVFAVRDGVIYTGVDGKPKSTQRLRRLANVEHNPQVSMLVDEYSDDWTRLWWVRADGVAQVQHDGAAVDTARAELRAKYPQYQSVSLDGPVLVIRVHRWSSWIAKRPNLG